MDVNRVYCGDAREVMETFPDGVVDMCVTSPPYWGLRDYGVDGQLGLEPSFEDYVDRLCGVFDEVKRVLKDGGTCWVNIGDSYNSHSTGKGGVGGIEGKRKNKHDNRANVHKKYNLVPDKCLVGIPFRFALEMINRGWILRNTIIWHKNNCMPSSVKDRFTVDFEYLFFFSKNKKYYFEQQFEPLKYPKAKSKNATNKHKGYKNPTYSGFEYDAENYKGRNKRCVWNINPKPYKGAHFAVFPEELIETPIKAGCPLEICNKCGNPRTKQYIKGNIVSTGGSDNSKMSNNKDKYFGSETKCKKFIHRESIFDGYSDCGCGADFHPGVVLDPFMGSGTTAAVAKRLNRNYIGIELNKEYHSLINERLSKVKVFKPLTSF